MKTMIQAELPPELTAQALAFVKNGWASDFNELLADALRDGITLLQETFGAPRPVQRVVTVPAHHAEDD